MDKVQKLKEKQASLIASGWDNPAAPSMAGQIEAAEKVQADLQSKSQIAAAKVKADQDYIQQTETALAALKLAADSQKKLQEEIDKYTKLVKDAQEAFAQSQAVADVNIGATKYVTQKGEQHGKLSVGQWEMGFC